MKDTVKSLLESETVFTTKSCAGIYSSLEKITESQNLALSFTPEKVIIQRDPETGRLLCEYANNIEKLMEDREYGFIEAVTSICNEFDINHSDLNIVITMEDTISIDDFEQLAEEYNFIAK